MEPRTTRLFPIGSIVFVSCIRWGHDLAHSPFARKRYQEAKQAAFANALLIDNDETAKASVGGEAAWPPAGDETAKTSVGGEAALAQKDHNSERKHELQTKLGKMVVTHMTHVLLIDTNQAIFGGSTIGARHCNANDVQGDGFCLLRSVCNANKKVGNWGQDEECRELLAEMVECQLSSSSEKTHFLILSLQKSLCDYIEALNEKGEAPEWVVTLLMDINLLAENGGIETLSGTARGMHPIASPPMSSHLIPHHPTPSHPIPSHPHTTTSHPIPPPR